MTNADRLAREARQRARNAWSDYAAGKIAWGNVMREVASADKLRAALNPLDKDNHDSWLLSGTCLPLLRVKGTE